VGGRPLSVEVAQTPDQLEQGLMFRKSLDRNEGMLFIFDTERELAFWMKNTFIPLSIGFFDKDKKLVDVQEMEPVGSIMDLSIPRYVSRKPAMYALEVNRGWFLKNGLKPGARFSFVK
jgi:uncharacterized membrane protein (UPF0127 family)